VLKRDSLWSAVVILFVVSCQAFPGTQECVETIVEVKKI